MSIRILSYNIHGGRGTDGIRDYRRLNHILDEHDIGIALLQEVDMRPKARGSECDMAKIYADRYPHFIAGMAVREVDGWFGNAILSRYPVLDSETIDITVPGHEPRNIIEAIINTPEGPLRVLNTHKGLSHGERRKQLQKLYHLLDRHIALPLFIGGDINEWHTSSKAMRELNTSLCPIRLGRTFPSFFPLFHLDRMWCRPAGILNAARTLNDRRVRKYSDHLPVVAELSIEGAVGQF